VDYYNVSSPDQISVRRIAEILSQESGFEKIPLLFTGGVDGGRGWRGDVKEMQLAITKAKTLGWTPKISSEKAIQLAAKDVMVNLTPGTMCQVRCNNTRLESCLKGF
jgi:UDP-glucose 4-epimerase